LVVGEYRDFVVILASLTTAMTLCVDGVFHDSVTLIFTALWNGVVADVRWRLLQQLDHVLCGRCDIDIVDHGNDALY